MSLIAKHVTPLVVAANRANSRRSTGPRRAGGKLRAAGNAGKHFVFGQVTAQRMEEIGEDPEAFERLWQSLRAAVGPRDGFEEILVEEMAVNRWRLARLHRAEMGTLSCERLRLVAAKLRLETGAPTGDSPTLRMFGLAGAEASPQKFTQILGLLQSLRCRVEKQGFTRQGLELLETIYGGVPDLPGYALIAKFKAEMQDAEVGPDDEEVEEPQSQDEDNEPSGAQPQGEGASQEQAQAASEGSAPQAQARQKFLESLDREVESFTKLGITDAIVRKAPVPESMKDACLIPFKENMEQMLRYEMMLERAFERMQKQLRDWRENQREARPGRPAAPRGNQDAV